MKLTKKDIGGMYDVEGADGSWAYLLVDVSGKKLLFRDFHSKYWIENPGKGDWKKFKPQLPPKSQIKSGWESARNIE